MACHSDSANNFSITVFYLFVCAYILMPTSIDQKCVLLDYQMFELWKQTHQVITAGHSLILWFVSLNVNILFVLFGSLYWHPLREITSRFNISNVTRLLLAFQTHVYLNSKKYFLILTTDRWKKTTPKKNGQIKHKRIAGKGSERNFVERSRHSINFGFFFQCALYFWEPTKIHLQWTKKYCFFFKSKSHIKLAFEKPVEQTDKPIKNR